MSGGGMVDWVARYFQQHPRSAHTAMGAHHDEVDMRPG